MRIGTRIVVLGLVLPALVAGCERTAPPETTPPPVSVTAEGGDLCTVAGPILAAVPREFIGSDEHVAQFDALAEVAPDELAADIDLMRDHYANDVSPANPDSQDFKNFPGPVQDAALRLQAELTDRCS